MKWAVLLCFVACLAAGSTGVGSSEGTDGKSGTAPAKKEVTREGVRMTVALPTKAVAGHPAVLSVELRQVEGGIQHYYGEPSRLQITVVDAEGDPIPLTRFGRAVLLKETKVPPVVIQTTVPASTYELSGDRVYHTFRLNLARLFDLSMAGAYKVSIVKTMRPVSGEEFSLEVPELALIILEPKEPWKGVLPSVRPEAESQEQATGE